MDLEFPLLSPNDLVVGKNSREEDLLLRAEDYSVRFQQIAKCLEEADDTQAFYKEIDAWNEEKLFPRLRALVDMPDADTKTMYSVVNYIHWAEANDLKVKFTLTDEDRRLMNLAEEAFLYTGYSAQPDQKFIATF